YIILVQANDRIKMARLIQKGFTKSEAAMRIKSQRPYRKMRRYADLIIFNNKSIETLKSQVKKSLKSWLEND
ncbi:MAG: dephospho-CoA kinase, partial [candidate division Zixibacteria bacterium]|nr:dephospho-CoA kinase [candidate division Zixibacteria bacterium]